MSVGVLRLEGGRGGRGGKVEISKDINKTRHFADTDEDGEEYIRAILSSVGDRREKLRCVTL